MADQLLFAWIGNTELRAARGELGESLGPIGQVVKHRLYSEIHLLSDHESKVETLFCKWLAKQTTAPIKIHSARLSGPTEFGEIYEAALSVLIRLESVTARKLCSPTI